MNKNSFLLHKDMLPVTVKMEKDLLCYYFSQDDERQAIRFLFAEMPGILVSEDDEDIISAIVVDNKISAYQGQWYDEYFEPIDGLISIVCIKELFCADSVYEFYIKLH
jgi:hypothetical protein